MRQRHLAALNATLEGAILEEINSLIRVKVISLQYWLIFKVICFNLILFWSVNILGDFSMFELLSDDIFDLIVWFLSV